ncbi:MAG: Reeler domain-containing protein [Crocinitomicaceae bacterium]
MMKFLLFILTGAILGYSLNSSKGELTKYHADGYDELNFPQNPPLEKTGAPGEVNCTDCHSGTTQSAAGTITYDFSDPNNEYIPGQSYTVSLSIVAGARNGFEMTILDASNTAAGTFTAGTNTSTASSGGREYIRHSASDGITSWSFTWNAPSTDMGNLTAYYAFNETNNNGTNQGDQIYLGQETILIHPMASVTDLEKLENKFSVVVDQSSKQVKLNYHVLNISGVQLNVIDLSGKLIYRESLGDKPKGNYQHTLDYSTFDKGGVYFVSLLIGNYALDQKVYLE